MQEFKHLIDTDAIVHMYFAQMIDEVPAYYDKQREVQGASYLRSVDDMLQQMNRALTTAPAFARNMLHSLPFVSILNWALGARSGKVAFNLDKVNVMLRKVMGVWAEFLNSRASLYVFNTSERGWCCDDALARLGMESYLNDDELATFTLCRDPVRDANFPYKSWNDFFTRRFKDALQRPIASEERVVVSACDSQVLRVQFEARMEDWFWVKGQPFSLQHMLANESREDRSG